MVSVCYLLEIVAWWHQFNSYVVNDGQLEIFIQKWDKPFKISTTAMFCAMLRRWRHFRIAIVKRVNVVGTQVTGYKKKPS